jgi:hypothetical protein
MNPYKLKAIIELLRAESGRLTGQLGVDFTIEELMGSVGLPELLDRRELSIIRAEMLDVVQAEAFLDKLRMRVTA